MSKLYRKNKDVATSTNIMLLIWKPYNYIFLWVDGNIRHLGKVLKTIEYLSYSLPYLIFMFGTNVGHLLGNTDWRLA